MNSIRTEHNAPEFNIFELCLTVSTSVRIVFTLNASIPNPRIWLHHLWNNSQFFESHIYHCTHSQIQLIEDSKLKEKLE